MFDAEVHHELERERIVVRIIIWVAITGAYKKNKAKRHENKNIKKR